MTNVNFLPATKEEFLGQVNNKFYFNHRLFPSFLSTTLSHIADLSVKHINMPGLWSFMKTEDGFVFAVPTAEEEINYSSKLNHSDLNISSILAGYCMTLIWLSLICENIDDEKTNDMIAEAHEKGMRYSDFDFLSEEDKTKMYSILD